MLSGIPMLAVFVSFSWPSLISRTSGDDMTSCVTVYTAQGDVMCLHVLQH